MKKLVKINIQGYKEREMIVIALASNGYKVWIEKLEINFGMTKDFLVCFEERS